MKFIGLLMVADEDDILERTLEHNLQFVDWFYVLDGSKNPKRRGHMDWPFKCQGAWRDEDLPRGYPEQPTDGYRQFLLQKAIADWGPDNYFLLLHGDEMWTTDPRDIATREADGWVMPLPFFFPREGEEWQDDVHPVDQLKWALGPGWPELRMFRGGPDVRYDTAQHFNVTPAGLTRLTHVDAPILHYPYRSPENQRARAARHVATGFDPDNYAHITDGDNVYWTDQMIARYRTRPQFRDLHELVPA